MGSNVNKHHNIGLGLKTLKAHFDNLEVSTIYESESVGFSGNHFLNLVVLAYTYDSMQSVCALLKQIENSQGRVRDKHIRDRTLDLDLLTFDNVVSISPVVLPRKEIEYNAFVLKPLADLVPYQRHPCTNQTFKEMWEVFQSTHPNKQQRLWATDLNWSENLA